MTKQDIIDRLTNECGLHRASAIRAVEGMISSISGSLARGESVSLRGFATFKPVVAAEKLGRNINTGAPVTIPARRTVKLILSKEFKESLNN